MRKSCFTLIELLVVVAIIAVLVAMLLPALSKVRQIVQSVACRSNMRQVGMGITFYANDNFDWIPNAWGDNAGESPHSTWSSLMTDSRAISWDIIHCPTAFASHKVYPTKGSASWQYPSYTYGMRYHTTGSKHANYINTATAGDSLGNELGNPSEYPIISDSVTHIGFYYWQSYRLDGYGNRVHIRHMGGANLLFLDTHSKWLSSKEIGNSGYGTSFRYSLIP